MTNKKKPKSKAAPFEKRNPKERATNSKACPMQGTRWNLAGGEWTRAEK
jgi:hypothetical protein